MRDRTHNMTIGNPLRNILLFSVPIFLGNIIQQFYNMADTIIVGRLLGETALGAVGSTSSLTFLIFGSANGIAHGFSILVSQAYGAEKYKRLKHLVAVSLILTVMLSLILSVITTLSSEQLLLWMKTPQDNMPYALPYIQIMFSGFLMTMLYNISSSILRSIGDSRTPLYFLILSCILNIILDIFFISALQLGTAGAAAATVISQGISALLCFIHMFRNFDILRLNRDDFYLDSQTILHSLSLGIPMSMNSSVIAIGTMILQSAVNALGSTAVAAYVAASRVEYLITQLMITIGSTMSIYCAQNLGAGKIDRIIVGVRKTFLLISSLAIMGLLLFLFGGKFIISWFVTEPSPALYDYSMRYLFSVGCFLLPLSWIFLYRNALQGLGYRMVLTIGAVSELLCRSAMIFLFLEPLGYWCICLVNPVTWIITSTLFCISYRCWKKNYILKRGSL